MHFQKKGARTPMMDSKEHREVLLGSCLIISYLIILDHSRMGTLGVSFAPIVGRARAKDVHRLTKATSAYFRRGGCGGAQGHSGWPQGRAGGVLDLGLHDRDGVRWLATEREARPMAPLNEDLRAAQRLY